MWRQRGILLASWASLILTAYSTFSSIDFQRLEKVTSEHIEEETQSQQKFIKMRREIKFISLPNIASAISAVSESSPSFAPVTVNDRDLIHETSLNTVGSIALSSKIQNITHYPQNFTIVSLEDPLDRSKSRSETFMNQLPQKSIFIAFSHVSRAYGNETYEPSSYSLYKIIPVEVTGPNGSVSIYALLDDGATETLIDREVSDYVGAEGPTVTISVLGVGGRNEKTNIKLVDIFVKGVFSNKKFKLSNVAAIRNMNTVSQVINVEDLLKFRHLRGIADELSYKLAIPTLVIGVDNLPLLLPHEIRRGIKSEPAAMKTLLGWTVFGKISGSSSNFTNGKFIMSPYIRPTKTTSDGGASIVTLLKRIAPQKFVQYLSKIGIN